MFKEKSTNITWHKNLIKREDREKLLGQKGFVLWFTGLSGSGKSTIANQVAYNLHKIGKLTYILDGDNIRHGLNKNLGFSLKDRKENIRRISEVANLFCDAGLITITAFISPYRVDRDYCRSLVGSGRFVEIYVKASLSTCESRDPKNLYKKARAGEITDFTGVNAPYEEPAKPEITVDTDKYNVEESVNLVLTKLKELGYL